MPMRKRFSGDTQAGSDSRTVLSRIATLSVDRDGEVLLPAGCDASDFHRSPTVFFNHDYRQPIGRCESIRRLDDRLEAATRFADRPATHEGQWLPDTLLDLIRQGVVNGFSVGFTPIESRKPTPSDRQRFGRDVKRVYSKWKLLEYSVAPLPANQDALTIAVQKGIVSAEAAAMLLPGSVDRTDAASTNTSLAAAITAPPRRVKLLLLPAPRVDPIAIARRHITDAVARNRGRLYSDA